MASYLTYEMLQAKSNVQTDVIDELLYANIIAKIHKQERTEREMKGGMDRIS